MKYQLILFDLDGTVLDTLADLADALNFALRQFGLPTRSTEEVRSFVGNGIRLLVERGVPAGTPAERAAGVLTAFTEYYTLHCADKTVPYAGIPALLQTLREKGCQTAVVSNKADAAVQKLAARYFPGLFDYCTGETEQIRKKPAPDMALAAMEALGVKKDAALFVGDSEVDIETARSAGLKAVSVTWGFKSRGFLLAHGAETLIDAPAELLKLL